MRAATSPAVADAAPDIFVDNDTGRTYTYADTKQLAEELGKGLKANWEWKKGDVMLMYTPNSIDTGPVTWGVHWAGGVVSPANPSKCAVPRGLPRTAAARRGH